jgi:predicted HTH transcriptional regulator
LTYDEIVKWANQAYPQRMYKSYQEWLSDVEQDFESQNHFFPQECYPLMENSWNDRHPLNPVEPLEHFDLNEPIKIRSTYRLQFRRPTESFSPKQLSQEFKINPNTMRRVIRELASDGVVERIAYGRYRFVG